MNTPRVVEALADHTIVGVAAGGRHSLFLTERGACFTAGANHAGQCGVLAMDAEVLAPVRKLRVPPDCAPLVQVSAGHAHTLLLTHAGKAYACGLNDRGQCGIEPDDGDKDMCVAQPMLISALLPHAVRAIDAAPNLSVFEVEEDAATHVTPPESAVGRAASNRLRANAERSAILHLVLAEFYSPFRTDIERLVSEKGGM